MKFKIRKKIMFCVLTCSFILTCFSGMKNHNLPHKHNIIPYEAIHESKIRSIALDNINKLASDFRKSPVENYEDNVKYALEHKSIYSKIYMHQDNPVGFITYTVYSPWYSQLSPFKSNPQSTILHLAVEKQYRGYGYGSALLKHTIDNCHKKSATKVSLTTTGWGYDESSDAGNFYRKFGFRVSPFSNAGGIGVTTNRCERFSLRLKPHPVIRFAQSTAHHLMRLLRK